MSRVWIVMEVTRTSDGQFVTKWGKGPGEILSPSVYAEYKTTISNRSIY